MPNETPNTEPDDTPFATWWIVSNLEQVVENDEAAYGLTNAIDALLGNLFTRVFDPNREQVARIRTAITRVVPVICQRLPITLTVAAQGLWAADHLIYRKWLARDWQSLPSKERRRITARLKILRNVSHAIALDEELAGHAVTPETLTRGTLFADRSAASAVQQIAQYLGAPAADEFVANVVIALRLVATAHLAGELARAPHDGLQALDWQIHTVSHRLLGDPTVSIGREPILHGLCAAIGLVAAPMLSPDERDADRGNDADRVDHVSLLASQLDALLREKRIAGRGDVFRQEYRAIETKALRGDQTMH